MTRTVTIKDVNIRLGETDYEKSIVQNIACILLTKQGSCPLYREFGLPQAFMHRPTTLAPPVLYAEIREAIETFETRCRVIHVEIEESTEQPGTLIPTVEVEILEPES